MAQNANYTTAEYTIQAQSASIGAAPLPAYVPVPHGGLLVESYLAVQGPSADVIGVSTTTVAILPGGVAANAVNVGGTLVTANNAARGTTVRVNHSGFRSVSEGDVIRLTPAGATGTSVVGNYVLKIRR